jgi:hypothetical protein
MALNIKINVRDSVDFNRAFDSSVANRIALGDPRPQALRASGSNLQGDFGGTSESDIGPATLRERYRGAAGAPPAGRARLAALEQGRRSEAGTLPAPEQKSSMPSRPAPSAGTADTDAAIRAASNAAGVDTDTMRSIASIESSMKPASNRNRRTQYKGLYQLGRDEWRRYGSGDIYNAGDNAMAAGRLFAAHRAEFRARFGREPTDRELYMMHQQGLGFYTRGAMTNIGGNRYPGMRGPQTHASFEAGWGRELERRRDAFARRELKPRITLGDISALGKK